LDITAANKISIVGNSGAGKSTLSKKLGVSLGIEVFSIDKIYWLPEWQRRDQASFQKLHDEWLNAETWIIDGVGYWKEMKTRLSESDMVIFLDTPLSLCKKRAATRIKEEKLAPNSHITAGCLYGDMEKMQMEAIETFDREFKPKLAHYLARFNPEKVKIIKNFEALDIKSAI